MPECYAVARAAVLAAGLAYFQDCRTMKDVRRVLLLSGDFTTIVRKALSQAEVRPAGGPIARALWADVGMIGVDLSSALVKVFEALLPRRA